MQVIISLQLDHRLGLDPGALSANLFSRPALPARDRVETINSAVRIDYQGQIQANRSVLGRFKAGTDATHLHVGGDSICHDSRISIRVHDTDCWDVGDVAFLDQCEVLRWVEDDDDVWEMRGCSDRFRSKAVMQDRMENHI
jgi:hypothetical protein